MRVDKESRIVGKRLKLFTNYQAQVQFQIQEWYKSVKMDNLYRESMIQVSVYNNKMLTLQANTIKIINYEILERVQTQIRKTLNPETNNFLLTINEVMEYQRELLLQKAVNIQSDLKLKQIIYFASLNSHIYQIHEKIIISKQPNSEGNYFQLSQTRFTRIQLIKKADVSKVEEIEKQEIIQKLEQTQINQSLHSNLISSQIILTLQKYPTNIMEGSVIETNIYEDPKQAELLSTKLNIENSSILDQNLPKLENYKKILKDFFIIFSFRF